MVNEVYLIRKCQAHSHGHKDNNLASLGPGNEYVCMYVCIYGFCIFTIAWGKLGLEKATCSSPRVPFVTCTLTCLVGGSS